MSLLNYYVKRLYHLDEVFTEQKNTTGLNLIADIFKKLKVGNELTSSQKDWIDKNMVLAKNRKFLADRSDRINKEIIKPMTDVSIVINELAKQDGISENQLTVLTELSDYIVDIKHKVEDELF